MKGIDFSKNKFLVHKNNFAVGINAVKYNTFGFYVRLGVTYFIIILKLTEKQIFVFVGNGDE